MGFMAALPGLISGVGSIFGGIFGSDAAKQAAQATQRGIQQAENTVNQGENQQLDLYSPYTNAGAQSTRTLSDLLATPGQGLLTPWTQTFTAPTAEQAAQTPGYQFQLQAGLDAMNNSAAGRGSLLTGRTLADLNNYAQGTASTNYQNTFNNSLTQYNSAYQTFLNNQSNLYNRLFGFSGLGLNATQGAAGAVQNATSDMANLQKQYGEAEAGGILGKANAMSNMFGGLTNSLSDFASLFNGNTNNGSVISSPTVPYQPIGTPGNIPYNPNSGWNIAPPPYMSIPGLSQTPTTLSMLNLP